MSVSERHIYLARIEAGPLICLIVPGSHLRISWLLNTYTAIPSSKSLQVVWNEYHQEFIIVNIIEADFLLHCQMTMNSWYIMIYFCLACSCFPGQVIKVDSVYSS